jgi:anti-sigma regulatory factor (Ser/Thr protein kinase)
LSVPKAKERVLMQTGGSEGSTRAGAAVRPRSGEGDLLAELVLPADADSLGLARLAAMHVAGVLGLPVGRLTELRLAVNEACALLFCTPAGAAAEGVRAGSMLRLRFERRGDRLRIEVRGAAPYRGPRPEEIGWVLLRALVDEVRMDTVGGVTTLTLCEPLPAS